MISVCEDDWGHVRETTVSQSDPSPHVIKQVGVGAGLVQGGSRIGYRH